MPEKIVMLCSEGFSTTALYNFISKEFEITDVIVEMPMRGMALARRRVKKLGWFTVAGQVAFMMMVVPILKLASLKRVASIRAAYLFDETSIPAGKISKVESVNSTDTLELMKRVRPAIVLVNGTRIISSKLLGAVPAVYINMHTGITPKYRGVHGGYWAMANNDPGLCGVTIHKVDKGIDTGEVLYQSLIPATSEDNFITYPLLQYGTGLPLVAQAVRDAMSAGLRPRPAMTRESRLWSHPTIWQYLYNLPKKRK